MKPLLLLIMLIPALAFSQFKITPENYKNTSDEAKNFIVIEVPEMPKDQLFLKVKSYINSNYKRLYFGYNEIENEQIVLDVSYTQPDAGIFDAGGMYSVSNRYEINFKDGKIMFRPSFLKLTGGKSDIPLNGGNAIMPGVYRNNGKLKVSKGMEGLINLSVNSFYENLTTALVTNNSDW